ncbi:MAG: S8 family peptidase [Phycisphaerae bacterium]|nr:S8 family peptidase [Phycisphaerae bacterium]
MLTRFERSTGICFLVVAVSFAWCAGAAHGQGAVERIPVLIGFKQQPGPVEKTLVRAAGGAIKHTYSLVPAIAATLPRTAVAALQNNPNVTVIEPDGEFHAVDAELDNTWGVKKIGAGEVHTSTTGIGVKVAILDSGINYNHPDLNGNYAGGYDFVNSDADPTDDNGHGTHVAGTVAAVDNNVGVVGAAPATSIYALKVLGANGSGSFSNMIAALDWCVANGIQITNNSYGSKSDPGTIVRDAYDKAYAKGVLHVAAAGNNGNPKGSGNNVGYPARYGSVIAVAATDQSDQRAAFSSTGDTVELAAPGVSINSTLMNLGYGTMSGTSMASPHVAGVAALVISAGITDSNGDGWINDEVRQILNSTAVDLGASGRDTLYGYGRVDAAAAVARVVPPPPPTPAVHVTVSTDKSSYTSSRDATAILTAVVTDETGAELTGLSESSFVAALNGLTASVTFTETAPLGTYTANLDISGLANGSYTVSVEVKDARAVVGTGSASFTISPPSADPTTATVSSIAYATEGGKDGNLHLSITLTVVDDLGNPVSRASVAIRVSLNGVAYASRTSTTGSTGTVTFKLNNAPSGCYSTTVTNVVASGLAWDGITPQNERCK